MNKQRYEELSKTGDAPTVEEHADGWHFCPDWDFLLIGPSMEAEWDCCTCGITKPEKNDASSEKKL